MIRSVCACLVWPVVALAFVAAAPAGAAAPGVTPGATVPVAPAEPEILVEADIRAVEAGLAVAGYAPKPVDGAWGEEDAAALRAYQADWGLPEMSEPTADLVARLTRMHPATRAQWVETEGSGPDGGCRVWNRYPQAQETVTWTGPCVDGLTSGTGVLTWTSVLAGREQVETYEGERLEGREHGQGVYLGVDGSRYEGGWRAGLKHGQGVFVSAEGHRYEGAYRDGLRHGYGVYRRVDGSSYEGAWERGVQHGFGVAIWPDGSRYEGELVDGRPEGEGTLSFADGNIYSGRWSRGCFAEPFRGATAGTTPADCGFE